MRPSTALFLAGLLLAAACHEADSGGDDAGRRDAGADSGSAPADAGARDAGAPVDAGSDAACAPRQLTFRTRFVGPDDRSCAESGIATVHFWIFRGSELVTDFEAPCADAGIAGPDLPPGDYELAAYARDPVRTSRFARGTGRLRAWFPDYMTCDPDPEPLICVPVPLHIEPCGPTDLSLRLACDGEMSGDDGCGGA